MELRQGSGNNKREAQQAISNVSAGNRFVAQLCPNRHRPPRTQTARELLRNCHIEAAAWDPITRNGRLAYALHITLPCFGCRLVVYRNTQNAARARCVSDSGTVHQLNLGERGQPHPFAWGGGGVAMRVAGSGSGSGIWPTRRERFRFAGSSMWASKAVRPVGLQTLITGSTEIFCRSSPSTSITQELVA